MTYIHCLKLWMWSRPFWSGKLNACSSCLFLLNKVSACSRVQCLQDCCELELKKNSFLKMMNVSIKIEWIGILFVLSLLLIWIKKKHYGGLFVGNHHGINNGKISILWISIAKLFFFFALVENTLDWYELCIYVCG